MSRFAYDHGRALRRLNVHRELALRRHRTPQSTGAILDEPIDSLFALHPMNVEPVAWVAELKTMLSMGFFLLALGGYRWYASEPA